VQPLDVGFTEAGVAPSQVIQRGHSIIIASGAQIIPRRDPIPSRRELLRRVAAGRASVTDGGFAAVPRTLAAIRDHDES
jgi:hypothetical protein